MYHIFFSQSSVRGHLGCFHALAPVHSATMNTGVRESFCNSMSFDKCTQLCNYDQNSIELCCPVQLPQVASEPLKHSWCKIKDVKYKTSKTWFLKMQMHISY